MAEPPSSAPSAPAPSYSVGDLQDPERALAVAYAPRGKREALRTLFALDERLGQVVATTTEPTIGLMRLTWWREAIERLGGNAAPAEPLLGALDRHVVAAGVSAASIARIEDGWAALLDEPDPDALVARHAAERGGPLFEAAAQALGAVDDRLRSAGEVWAFADLGLRHSSTAVRAAARRRGEEVAMQLEGRPWPRPARPLAALLVLARRDLKNGTRRQGSPSRLLRMLALRLFAR